MANGQLNAHRFNMGHTEIVICSFAHPTEWTPNQPSLSASDVAENSHLFVLTHLLCYFGTFDPCNTIGFQRGYCLCTPTCCCQQRLHKPVVKNGCIEHSNGIIV